MYDHDGICIDDADYDQRHEGPKESDNQHREIRIYLVPYCVARVRGIGGHRRQTVYERRRGRNAQAILRENLIDRIDPECQLV